MTTNPGQPKMRKAYAIIHGHFYQPPRENPWTQTVPHQESAKPHHDWNERITAECYQPNTRARMLDDRGQIVSLGNNFASLSFNVGPTLFSWLETAHPDVYQRILAADQQSCVDHDGHGNAIAQVYNHTILPLATQRDQLTQIRWGLREFAYRFKRPAEAVWLSETAINQTTVACLIAEGVKFVILSPTQAQRVRKIGERAWTDVSDSSIDPTQPYRLFLSGAATDKGQPEGDAGEGSSSGGPAGVPEKRPSLAPLPQPSDKHLDVVFYDGRLANDIGFSHLLRDGDALARRIHEVAAKSASSNTHIMVPIATDGETYGHHEAGGERVLASLVNAKLPGLQIEVTNFSHFLAMVPPTMEVELKLGSADGEGTSWSCSHGVGRWYRDCGCNTGGAPGWNQKWRGPLRRSIDLLRETASELFERIGATLLVDPWRARDDYIECILDRTPKTREAFLERHAAGALTDEQRSTVLRLLEAQRYVQFAYTSCGWFFNDISGIEPQQNLRYAARAIQLLEEIAPPDLETRFLDLLHEAKSNIPEQGTGRDVYVKYIRPDVYTPERAANQVLLHRLIQRPVSGKRTAKPRAALLAEQETLVAHTYNVRCLQVALWQDLGAKVRDDSDSIESLSKGGSAVDPSVYCGRLVVTDADTLQTHELVFVVFTDHNLHPVSYLMRAETEDVYAGFAAAAVQQLPSPPPVVERSRLATFLEQAGLECYSAADIYPEDRERMFGGLLEAFGQLTEEHLEIVYGESLGAMDYLAAMGLPMPKQYHASVEFALSSHVMSEMEKLYTKEVGQYAPSQLQASLRKVLQITQTHRLTLDTALLKQRLHRALADYLSKLTRRFLTLKLDGDEPTRSRELDGFLRALHETLELIELAEQLGVKVDHSDLQNMTFEILERTVPRYLQILRAALESVNQTEGEHEHFPRFFQEYRFMQKCLKFAKRLNFNIERYREYLISAELTMQS